MTRDERRTAMIDAMEHEFDGAVTVEDFLERVASLAEQVAFQSGTPSEEDVPAGIDRGLGAAAPAGDVPFLAATAGSVTPDDVIRVGADDALIERYVNASAGPADGARGRRPDFDLVVQKAMRREARRLALRLYLSYLRLTLLKHRLQAETFLIRLRRKALSYTREKIRRIRHRRPL